MYRLFLIWCYLQSIRTRHFVSLKLDGNPDSGVNVHLSALWTDLPDCSCKVSKTLLMALHVKIYAVNFKIGRTSLALVVTLPLPSYLLGGEILAGEGEVWFPGVAVPAEEGRRRASTLDQRRQGAHQEAGAHHECEDTSLDNA